MKIIEQSIELMEDYAGASEAILWKIEAACRNCYKSEGKNAEHDLTKRDRLIRGAVARGHNSVLEHQAFTFRVTCDRGVSHEWVRHRIGCSYSQESTRYCNYGHSEGITVIWPADLGAFVCEESVFDRVAEHPEACPDTVDWLEAMLFAEKKYLRQIARGRKPEHARGVLPTDLKTEIVVTMNVVALRHFFRQRCTPAAHPQIRKLAINLLEKMNNMLPVLFEDIAKEYLIH